MKSTQIIHIYTFFFILPVAAVLFSCSRAFHPDIERGAEYRYQADHPEVRMSALGILDVENDIGVIHIAADIVDGNLIFKEHDGVRRAEIEIEIRITGTGETSYSDTYTTTLPVDRDLNTVITSPQVVQFEKEMNVPPGQYDVHFSALDKSSKKQTIRTTTTFIPDPGDDIVNLTSIQLLGKNSASDETGYVPVTTYHVSTAQDSIRFVLQVTNNRSEDPLTIRSQLVRFNADSSPARPMSFSNYTPSSISYKGIDFRDDELVDQSLRTLEDPGSVLIEYRYKRPEKGNYRFKVTTESSGAEEELFKARDFSIKGKNFPHIRTPRELAEPLIYLMNEDAHRKLLSIENPDSLKEAVDRFWLSNVGSINKAKNVVSLYYERVEEANKQFTNFKEGWKTDMGLVYILFGPPWYVETRLNRMQWSYSYDRQDPRYNFFFERPRGRSEFFPFNNYLLQRDQSYFTLQYQQTQRWRSGSIVNVFM